MAAAEYRRVCDLLEQRASGRDVRVDSPGADLRGADLRQGDLVGANLRDAKLDRATLIGAKLAGACLDGACLDGANLNGADLCGASLVGASLSSAVVVGTRLAGADLRGACLKDLQGFASTYAGARIDVETVRRSEMTDPDVIQLWRAGVDIESLDGLSRAVRHAVRGGGAEEDDDLGPSSRQLATIEAQLRRALVNASVPPPSNGATRGLHDPTNPRISFASAPPERPSDRPPESLSLTASVPDLQSRLKPCKSLHPGGKILGVDLRELVGSGNAGSVWRAVGVDGRPMVAKIFDPQKATALPAMARGVRAMNHLALHAGGAPPPSIGRFECVSLNELVFTTEAAVGNLHDVPMLRWPIPRIVRLMTQIAEAIAWAHEAGIVHRCLKPSNVLLRDDFSAVVVDFDMVDLPRLRSERPSDIGGYAAYAAPEEVFDVGTQSPTADVFSLGRLLYFLLTGKAPDEPLVDVPRLASIERDQPAGLVRIVRKCTMLDAAARYQQVSALLTALGRYDKHDEVGIQGAERNFLARSVSSIAPPLKARRPEKVVPDAPSPVALRTNRGWHVDPAAQRAIGAAAGAFALLAFGLLLLGPRAPAGDTRRALSDVVAGARSIACFTLWRPKRPSLHGRLAAALAVAWLVVVVDPARLVTLRATIDVHSSDPRVRADAVRLVARAGKLDMQGMDLSGLELADADLTLVDLRHANLVRADLRGAGLREAKLADADMLEADLDDADLAQSDAPEARSWLTTSCSAATRMPPGWICSSSGHPSPQQESER